MGGEDQALITRGQQFVVHRVIQLTRCSAGPSRIGDVPDRQPLGPRRGDDLLEIPSGVDDDRLARLAVADEVADAGDAGRLEAFEDHAVLRRAVEVIPPTV